VYTPVVWLFPSLFDVCGCCSTQVDPATAPCYVPGKLSNKPWANTQCQPGSTECRAAVRSTDYGECGAWSPVPDSKERRPPRCTRPTVNYNSKYVCTLDICRICLHLRLPAIKSNNRHRARVIRSGIWEYTGKYGWEINLRKYQKS